ncbi:hypothetical protein [Mycolicibacterium sp. CBMA 234]|uniref:hypothetical protein n=1 Tax=Mycolicibacterium sp. CBMA 234 TaxID=1918495 RepID=UPI0012DFC67D|nr:hypothetical protein [Mycolicibacterium sp. CBMA 234]
MVGALDCVQVVGDDAVDGCVLVLLEVQPANTSTGKAAAAVARFNIEFAYPEW